MTFSAYLSLSLILNILVPALVGWLLSRAVKLWLGPRITAKAQAKGMSALEILSREFTIPVELSIQAVGYALALRNLPVTLVGYEALVMKVLRILVVILMTRGLWGSWPLCSLLLREVGAKLSLETNQILLRLLSQCYKVLMIALGALVILQELGIPVTGLVTGVGLVGLTVSLGAQETASSLFAGVILILEKPFSLGDWITVGEVEGSVEDISFRSTRIRTIENTLVVLPNSKVSAANIWNATRRTKRHWKFTLGLTYDTSREKMEEIIQALRQLLEQSPAVVEGSVLVNMSGFSASSLDITVECYLKALEKDAYLADCNHIYLEILDKVRELGGDFAFPSTTVYLQK